MDLSPFCNRLGDADRLEVASFQLFVFDLVLREPTLRDCCLDSLVGCLCVDKLILLLVVFVCVWVSYL